ncbi:ROK family transcriptional regulator [Mycetocola spongiae]|nr:ROK family transcriptional regulator [Mycetocola spongiae]
MTGTFSASQLLQLLRDGAPRTRSELAQRTGLSRSTIAQRIDELMGLGLIVSTEDAISTGGRPSARFELNATGRIIIAIDMGATHCSVGLTDVLGTVIDTTTSRMDIARGPRALIEECLATATELLKKNRRARDTVVAVGIGLPGPVEFATGRPDNPPIMPGWHDFDVPACVRETFDVPTLVDNDVNIAALGERTVRWPEVSELIYVKVATGIGAGIISGSDLQRGSRGIAGDIGHVRVSKGAEIQCTCGNFGCLEATAGGPAIARNLRAVGIAAESNGDIVDLALNGNLTVTGAVREAGRTIGEVLTTCVSIINPSVIVIGGSISTAGDHLLAGIREVVYSNSIPLATENLTIVQSRVGAHAGIIGAGVMAGNHVLSASYINEQIRTLRAV